MYFRIFRVFSMALCYFFFQQTHIQSKQIEKYHDIIVPKSQKKKSLLKNAH